MLGAGIWSSLGVLPMLFGRPDIGFYFLLPAAATLGIATARPGMAGVGALVGSLPLLTLVGPDNYADAVSFVNLSPPVWVSGPALVALGLPLALGLARSASAPAAPRAARWIVLCAAAAGAALLIVNVGRGSYDRLHRREVRVWESVDLSEPTETHATLRLSSAENLRGLRTNLPGLPLLDRRATESTLPFEPPVTLREGVPRLTLEVPEQAEEEYVRDLRVVTLPPGAVDRARITLRSTDPLRILDDGVWITKNRFVRRHVYADESPTDTFRLSGRAGQTVLVDVQLDLTSDILGARLSADDTVFQWFSTISWHGSVTL